MVSALAAVAAALTGNGGSNGFGGGSAPYQSGGAGAGMGGAIFNDAGTVSLINTTLSANTAQGGGGHGSGNASGYGGAIFNYMGSLTLDFVTLSDNTVIGGNGANSYTPAGNADGGAHLQPRRQHRRLPVRRQCLQYHKRNTDDEQLHCGQ